MNIKKLTDEYLYGGDGRPLSDKQRMRRYYLLYTLLFSLVCCLVFFWYYTAGRTFVAFDDGWRQHYRALVYYGRYLRSMARELLYHHRIVFPEWDFALGEGSDILQSLHYYVIGDPFALFSVLFPSRFMWVCYDFIVLLRLYLAGIAFSCLCFYTRKNAGRYAVMAGAIAYVFCYWGIFSACRHTFFLNPMLYFPMIVLGIEKIIRGEKPDLLIVSVFLAAVSNFFFFYLIVLMTVIYVAVRLIAEYRSDVGSMLKTLLRIAGSSVLGTMMGGVIVLPVAYDFLNDARMDSGHSLRLAYSMYYYSKFPGLFFSGGGGYWSCLGYSAPVIPAVFLLFLRKKRHRALKVFFLIGLVILLIPALGQILNGMSYKSNRWTWAFALLCAYILVLMWPELMDLPAKDARKLALALSGYFFFLFALRYSRDTATFAGVALAFVFLLVIYPVPAADPEAGPRLRETLGIPGDAFVLLYPAEFSPRKSQAVLIQAMAELPERAVLVLCGQGEEREACMRLARELGLGERVRFPGQVEDMPAWYRMADAAVTAARSEGLPFNVMEAMHMGLPVVASRVKGNADLVTEGETGLLYPYGDAAACAACLRRLMEDRGLCAEMGAKARKRAEPYALERVLPQVMELYLGK